MSSRFSVWPAVFGLLAGVGVFLVTHALSQTDIGGAGWSLRGNGALIVLFAAAPALLAGGWVALAGCSRLSATAAGLSTLLLNLLVAFGPIVLGPDEAMRLSLVVAIVLLVLAALAGLLIARGRGRAPAAVACVIAISLSLVVPGLEFVLVPVLVPVVLVTPIVARRWSVRLAAACLMYLVGVLVGDFGSQFILGSG